MPANVTPIDPGDVESLGRIAYDNNTILPGAIGMPATWDEMARWPDEKKPWRNSALAVARSVVPPHHAVYDTREFVLVSVHDVERMDRLTAIGNQHAGFVAVPVGTLDDIREVLGCIPTGYEPVDATRRLRALLPEGGDASSGSGNN